VTLIGSIKLCIVLPSGAKHAAPAVATVAAFVQGCQDALYKDVLRAVLASLLL